MTANQPTELSSPITLSLPRVREALITLTITSTSFVKRAETDTAIWAASRDWFLEPWGRDTFISLPGLLLSTKRFAEARQVFLSFAMYEKNGLIPNRIQADNIEYNTVDASLWFIVTLEKYYQASGDKAFVKEIWPTVKNILAGYTQGTNFERSGQTHHIKMDEDGLIISPPQATWMDADPSNCGETIITPRNGKAVEINVLWYSALRFAEDMTTGKQKTTYKALAAQVKKSFNTKFWNESEKCLCDVIEGDPHSGALRPNQIIAISHGKGLLGKTRERLVLSAVKRDLLTPGGLRTLSPRDSNYQGYYDTFVPIEIKDYWYHQGTVWPWLIGPYVDALFIVRAGQGKYADAIKKEALTAISPLLKFATESPHRSLPEVFSGNEPHAPGGTTSQAWSVAEVLRVLVDYELC